jgi:hypothetical protein
MFYARLLARRLLGGPLPVEPKFDADNARPLPVLTEVRDRAGDGDWPAVHGLLNQAGRDWDLRAGMLAELAAAADDDDRWLSDWLRSAPSDPTAVLLEAKLLGRRASKARGSAVASETSAEQARAFHALSAASARAGRRAMERAIPGDPSPWTHILGTMFADRRTMATWFGDVYAEGRRRDPHNFELHSNAITLHCAKWYGSHEQMFEMAGRAAAAAPPGHKSVLLPLHAHFEYAMREYAWNIFTDESLRDCKRYFRRPDVQQDIDRWITKFRSGPPTSARLGAVRQWMAIYYSLAGRKKEAKAVFDELGEYVTPVVEWAFFWGTRKYGYRWSWWWSNGVH